LYLNIILGILVIIFSFTLTASFGEADENMEDLIEKGIELAESGQYEEALIYFDRVLENNPDNIRALNAKGVTLGELERYEEAFSYHDRALEQDPDNLLALNSKGVTFVKLERYEEALHYFEKILAIDPTNDEVLTNKITTLLKLAQSKEDVSYLDRVLDMRPDHFLTEAWILKGQFLTTLGNYEEAISYFDQVLLQDPNNIQTLNLKGQLLANLEEFEEAISYFDRALLLEPQNHEIQSNWATVYQKLPIDEIDGFARVQIRDQNGSLIAYSETTTLKIIRHSLSYEVIDKFNFKGVITIDGKDFNVYEMRIVPIPLTEKFIARFFIGAEIHERTVYPIIASTDGFFFQKEDSIIVDWIILRPV